jgi:IMP and pyridine-specific 5'-nucleotidase
VHVANDDTGGNDVFVDIGDKSWGVRACQRYFGGIEPSRTLHVGDQFLSAGANDFKVSLFLSILESESEKVT